MPTPFRAERVNPRLRCCCRSRDDAEDAIAGPHAVYSHVVAEVDRILSGVRGQIFAQAKGGGSIVDLSLCLGEMMGGVRSGKVTDDDLLGLDSTGFAAGDRIAEGLQQSE
jgi:hypothetical protein